MGEKGQSEAGPKKAKRWSVREKERVVLRLLRGESLEAVAREEGVPAQRLVAWRDAFLAGGRENLKARPGDAAERQLKEAQAKIGELMMKPLLEGRDQLLRRGRRSKR